MKRGKKIGLLTLFVLHLFLMTGIPLLLTTQTAYAAESGNGAQELESWQTTKGSIKPADVPEDRFYANSPKSITDRTTGDKYTTSASDSEIFASGSEEVWQRGWYWYWPEDKVLKKKENGKCYGAIAVLGHGGKGSGNGNRALNIYLVQPTERADGENCTLPGVGDGGTNAEGRGGEPEDEDVWDITKQMSEGSKVLLVTPLKWVSSSEITVANRTDRTLKKATGGYIDKIRDYINDDGEERKKTYAANNYQYFYTQQCLQDDDELECFIAVTPGGNRAAVFHRRGGDLNLEWDGQQLQKLFGRNIVQGPRGLIGGSTKSAIIGVYGTANADDNPDTTDPDTTDDDTTTGETGDPDCDGGSLSWMVCPLVNGLASLADGIVTTFLRPILRAEILALPGSGGQEHAALYEVWKGFRNIANALLILAFMAIIVSTAISSE